MTNGKSGSPLGQQKGHSLTYDPSHLFPVSRKGPRKAIGAIPSPFTGKDIWNCYELSWLNPKGKPQIALARFIFPSDSENIIESKSVKLYLNSFNQTRFGSLRQVKETIEKDLSEISKARVDVSLLVPEQFSNEKFAVCPGVCLDNLDVAIDRYQMTPDLLTVHKKKVKEQVYSNLMRTNCPVTAQPDWASIMVEYRGNKIDHKGLLKYLISFRNHTGFHENCVEQVFMDLFNRCSPERLLVYARFTRRGGLDINPYRSNYNAIVQDLRLTRQ
ncbi:MAG: NADPH-dependent 7-cyano-7-deazaguanine reductase QueF [Desulfobacteraceae bacterium]